MKKEYETNIRKAISKRKEWLSSNDRNKLEKSAIEALEAFPESDIMLDQLNRLSQKKDFILCLLKIKQSAEYWRETPPPQSEFARIENGLLKYIGLAKNSSILNVILQNESWSGIDQKQDFEAILLDLESRIKKISEYRKENKKKYEKTGGRTLEYWQYFVVQDLKRKYQIIFNEPPSMGVNSPFTRIVQIMLQEITGGEFSERHHIVKDIFSKIEKIKEMYGD